MQCKYCSKQIVDDSIYCSYCGREVELEREEDLHKQADCIIPGAPKKHCAVCGKSLPNSTVSDMCALCTIKQRNQERAEHLNDPPKQTSYQPKDRYDISDEFDNSVFEQNKNSYYRGEEEFSLEEEYSRPKKRSFKQSFPHDPAKKSKKGCAAPAVVIIIIVIVGLNLVLDVAGGILGAFFDRIPEIPAQEEAIASVPAEAEASYEENIQDIYDLSEFEPDAQEISQIMIGDYFTDAVDMVEYDFDTESQLYTEGAYVYYSGRIAYEQDGVSHDDYFVTGFVVSETYYYPLYLEIGYEVCYDYRNEVDSNGCVTWEGAYNLNLTEGDPILDEPILFFQ